MLRLNECLERLGCNLRQELDAAVVAEVTVWAARKAWRIEIISAEIIPAGTVKQIENDINSHTEALEEVQLVVTADDPAAMITKIMAQYWQEIVAAIADADILHGAEYRVDKDHLIIEFGAIEDWEKAIQKDICLQLERAIFAHCCVNCMVSARHTQSALPSRRQSPAIGEDNIVPTEVYSGKRRESGRKNSQEKDLSEYHPVSLADLQEGMTKVVIQGEVITKKIRELKNGRRLTLCDVTDYMDTVTLKMWDDDSLQEKTVIRALGDFHYDQFEKETLFFPSRTEVARREGRVDQASEKRVELHLHTTMSTLDGLTHIKALIDKAADFGHQALAITDHGSIQAFPEAFKHARKKNIKILYGVEGYLVDEHKQDHSNHIILLAASETGLNNLYSLISDSYLNNFYRTPRILRSQLESRREGIILGSACERGEVIRSYLDNRNWEELKEIARFYDYLEIQPITNNEFLVRKGILGSAEALMEMNRAIVKLAKELDLPVVATGDVHFLEPHDDIYRRIIQAGKGYDDADNQAALYYRTTEEMLAEFDYLGQETAYEVVVTNPNLVADKCENLRPVPEGHFSPMMEGAAERLTDLTWGRAYECYGDPLPELVKMRVERELHSITLHGFSELYLIAYELVKKSNSDGYLVGSRGSVGSSLVAFLTGITEVNPLVPHYRCGCGYSSFIEDGSVFSGADLPGGQCPQCGKDLIKDGFEIPFETFLGIDGDKVPDIDLNFSGEYQSQAHQFVEELFGKEHVFRAGTISTIGEKTAYGYVKKYEEQTGSRFRRAEIDRLVNGITGIKRTTGQHPGGLMIIPGHMDVHRFTPLQHPAEDADSQVVTTHFEYEALSGVLVKLDVLGHDDPTMIKYLEDLTGINATTISLDEPQTMALFSGVASLGVKPEDIRAQVGTYGIPEFNTRFVRQMLEVTRPRTFSELVRISGLSHGTDVWTNNAHDLIRNQHIGLNDVIATRDDIMTYLIQQGLSKLDAFWIMEKIRKGKAATITPNEFESMRNHNIPEWYINSCMKIQYMFPKAHAVAYVMMAYRIAFFKVYYPLAFYASFFSVRAQDFDEAIFEGYNGVRSRLDEIESLGQNASPKEKALIPILEVALEMQARGFKFYNVDLYRSEVGKFTILDQGLLVPFSALPGVGEGAARNLFEGRQRGKFTSVEDVQRKTKANKSVMEILEKNGCLEGLPQSDQISLFG